MSEIIVVALRARLCVDNVGLLRNISFTMLGPFVLQRVDEEIPWYPLNVNPIPLNATTWSEAVVIARLKATN